jgi:hypothetical protein
MGKYAPIEGAERARRRALFRMVRDAAIRATADHTPAVNAAPRAREAIILTLELLERDPLASAGAFPGDLLRCLMELPARLWRGESVLYDRYRAAVRAAAMARRYAPPEVQQAFWRDLPDHVEDAGASD